MPALGGTLSGFPDKVLYFEESEQGYSVYNVQTHRCLVVSAGDVTFGIRCCHLNNHSDAEELSRALITPEKHSEGLIDLITKCTRE